MDLAETCPCATPVGGRYDLVVLYDYGKLCWVVVLRAKSDTADQLLHLIVLQVATDATHGAEGAQR